MGSVLDLRVRLRPCSLPAPSLLPHACLLLPAGASFKRYLPPSSFHYHASSLLHVLLLRTCKPSPSFNAKRIFSKRPVRAAFEVAEKSGDEARRSAVRPSPAEAARTLMEVCSDGTLSTLSDEDGWPVATSVRFAVDSEGRPFFHLSSLALHTRHLVVDSRCSLHVQPGRQRPQCTLKGRVTNATCEKDINKMRLEWDARFGNNGNEEGTFFGMDVHQALQLQDIGEEEVWVSGLEYYEAIPDPLRECAYKIVEDMNKKHWDDIRRFCTVYTNLDVKVEEASLTWVDRLGFDLRVLTSAPEQIMEIRVPFPREVNDERDARSSLTMMAQLAWEHERHYSSLQLLTK
ncbi:hypothetical protein O6H91_02G083900 [Diphasiastrum complanatum]|uniref:Uncharacterized protein n=1 Tax=Diphasiastrum complanatum TaxID=34168 RepID=A0ACC2EHV7_DIPCM|nr:hypothetical protein O6H91_02G083900 [Diphasiastrum complanatum]